MALALPPLKRKSFTLELLLLELPVLILMPMSSLFYSFCLGALFAFCLGASCSWPNAKEFALKSRFDSF